MMMVACLLLATSLLCTDRISTVADRTPGPEPLRLSATLTCRMDVVEGSARCRREAPELPGGVSAAILKPFFDFELHFSDHGYSAADSVYRASGRLLHRLEEPIGTPDWQTVNGSRVFIEAGPHVWAYRDSADTSDPEGRWEPLTLGSSGGVRLLNPDGQQNFTGADQPYIEYREIIEPNEPSASREWLWHVPPEVKVFAFQAKVFTSVPSEQVVPDVPPDTIPGWIYDPENMTNNDSPYLGGMYPRFVVFVMFLPDTPREEKQAAVDLVRGQVIGGIADGNLYAVRVDDHPTAAPLFSAIEQLSQLPQVRAALPDLVFKVIASEQTVPDVPPDSVPAWVYAPENLTRDDSPFMAGMFPRNVVFVRFHEGTSRQEKQAAVDLIHGAVVGGIGSEYLIQIVDDGTTRPLFQAIDQLEALPQVSEAGPDPIISIPHLRPGERGLRRNEDRGFEPRSVGGLERGDERVPSPRPGLAASEQIVPEVAPDSVPAWVYAPENLTRDDSPFMAGAFPRNVVFVAFKEGTPREERQAAVDLVRGSVVGGRRGSLYLIRVADDGTTRPLFEAIRMLEALPQVAFAEADPVVATTHHPRPDRSVADPTVGLEASGHHVPEVAPHGYLISEDSVAALFAPRNAAMDHPRMSGPYPRNLVMVAFHRSATRDERQAAVDLIGGRVIGGLGYFYYQIQIEDDGTADPLWRAVDLLNALPQVLRAGPDVVSQSIRSFRAEAFTAVQPVHLVPEVAPHGYLIPEDSVASLYAPRNAAMDHPRMSGPYPRNLVMVAFHRSATRDERQAAVDLIGGRVIGGLANVFYYVLIEDDGTANPLWEAVDLLSTLPAVSNAGPDVLTGSIRAMDARSEVGQREETPRSRRRCGGCSPRVGFAAPNIVLRRCGASQRTVVSAGEAVPEKQ